MIKPLKQQFCSNQLATLDPSKGNLLSNSIGVNELTFYLYDHLGNNRLAFGISKNLIGYNYRINYAAHYFPYGKVMYSFSDGGSADRYPTTGHERDDETGLDYRGARFYDSEIGRFLSLDPLASKYPSLSAYNYVAGNPIVFVDPDGKVIEYVGTRREQRRLERNINRIERNSETGAKLISDLRGSNNVHTISQVRGNEESITTKKEDGTNGSNIQYNFSQKNEGGGASYLGLAHEIGHSWRIENGKIDDFKSTLQQPKPNDFSLKAQVKRTENASKSLLHEEIEASHIENIVRAEVGATLRQFYSNIKQFFKSPLDGKVTITQIPQTSVIKEGYDYNKSSSEKYLDLKTNN